MRVHVVSDVHGAVGDLPAASEDCDVFICLGDLLLYLDYADPRQGAFAEVFGVELPTKYIELRKAKKFDEARALTASAWAEVSGGADPDSRMARFVPIIERQYSEIFAAIPPSALMTLGNVDVPALATRQMLPGQRILDGEVVVRGGVRFGFVGSGLPSRYRTPNEIPVSKFDSLLAQLGDVDVLCTHIPPAVPELTFDVVARRFEVGSEALLALIEQTQPRYALFGQRSSADQALHSGAGQHDAHRPSGQFGCRRAKYLMIP